MAASIADKLKIYPKFTLLTINAPAGFMKEFQSLPTGVKTTNAVNKYNQVNWFVMDKAQMEKEMSKVMKVLKPELIVWVYYPKGTSKQQTDLTRNKGWDCLFAEGDKLTWINLISFNDTWSVFGFRAKTDADRKKETRSKVERKIFNWVNPATKEIKLPEDLAALKKNKKESVYFNALSFTNKKEYIEWIVTAKRKETKAERINGTIERLGKGWKNPANR